MGFDSVFQYDIPYLHPLVVHFPLVLLLLAGGAAAAYSIMGTAVWRRALLILLALGALAAFAAEQTGKALEESMEGMPILDELVEFHEAAAHWTVRTSFLALFVGLVLTIWWRRRQSTQNLEEISVKTREPLWMRLVLLALAGFAAALVAYTAHIGAVMVWGV